jgi:hypothetical protein
MTASAMGRLAPVGMETIKETAVTARAAKTTIRLLAALAVLAAVCAGVAVSPATSHAAVGDNFGFAQVNDPDSGTSAPAFPNVTADPRAWWAGVCDLRDGAAAVGTLPTDFASCIDHPAGNASNNPRATVMPLAPGVASSTSGPDGWTNPPSWRIDDVTTAAGHPDGTASFWFSRSAIVTENGTGSSISSDGSPRNITVKLPPGVIGNPNAVPQCSGDRMTTVPTTCPPKSQVGVSTVTLANNSYVMPVYNAAPRDGKTAEFVMSVGDEVLNTNIAIVGSARTDGDFGVDAMAVQIPAGLPLRGQTFTLWGVPWAASHDRYRPIAGYCGGPPPVVAIGLGMPVSGLEGGVAKGCSQQPQSYDPSWGPIKPFLTTQTECSSTPPVTTIIADNWHSNVVATEHSVAPLVDGCGDVPFDAEFGMATTASGADSATGLDVGLSVPQNNDPPAAVRFNPDDASGAPSHWKSVAGRATSHLKDSVVTLPEGLSVNPSAASGLVACSDGQVGVRDASTNPLLFNDGDPFDGNAGDGVECPAGSVIGTAQVKTPLLDEILTGHVVLGEPKSTDPASGQMLRMFLVVRSRERGLIAKIYGSATADPQTGRLQATFENNPRVPFDRLDLKFKGGSRGLLATQPRCDSRGWSATFIPWSGGAGVVRGGAFQTNANCASGFSPSLVAGMDSQAARGSGTFSFRFSRQDGEQYLHGLTATLPKGLLASVRDVPLCANAQANVGACPAASKIGIVDAKAGAGDPFVLEEKGEVFLTDGYKGGQYGLAVKIRGVAGPFRNQMELSPIVVRQAIHVDRKTAQVTAVSDPFPLIHHGVPLRVREVTVLVNRGGFMLNPSDCSAKQVDAALISDQGSTANLSNAFGAAGCKNLAFKPKLSLRLTGRKQVRTGKHPGIRATVTQNGTSEAGIERAEVRLPKSLALDVDNAQALCEFDQGTKPDLENHCPKGSIVGRSRAVSPLLKKPLVGNVYFVKNVRRSSSGNLIRTLPMIVVALRGEIAINLVGESNVKNGKLVNTFDQVPDAPITRFNLNIKGGRNGIIAVTRTRKALINLCAKPKRHTAEADIDGHNGRRYDRDIRMNTPCAKKTKAQKRRAAAKRNTKRGQANSGKRRHR